MITEKLSKVKKGQTALMKKACPLSSFVQSSQTAVFDMMARPQGIEP
jgi:hypothetical protein